MKKLVFLRANSDQFVLVELQVRTVHESEVSVNIDYMNMHFSKNIPVASRDTNTSFQDTHVRYSNYCSW